ncbi:MAG: hypothetical protein A2W36_05145 [Chloroflexi bacterium RBG_16_58_14]|nr:MAG: hypothetical protein A2W36_05145 [Chloroflexi bacterium RBG_16_58_14]
MSKKKTFPSQSSLFPKGTIPQMPEGYYSSNPNPNLRRFTGIYDSFDLEGEEVILRGVDEPRRFSVLSTGTYEQALLALRMGFARMIAGDQPLFLILDDAFQHSDWKRRPWLVETLGKVATSGWQVFYFSMDDHIRD